MEMEMDAMGLLVSSEIRCGGGGFCTTWVGRRVGGTNFDGKSAMPMEKTD